MVAGCIMPIIGLLIITIPAALAFERLYDWNPVVALLLLASGIALIVMGAARIWFELSTQHRRRFK